MFIYVYTLSTANVSVQCVFFCFFLTKASIYACLTVRFLEQSQTGFPTILLLLTASDKEQDS